MTNKEFRKIKQELADELVIRDNPIEKRKPSAIYNGITPIESRKYVRKRIKVAENQNILRNPDKYRAK